MKKKQRIYKILTEIEKGNDLILNDYSWSIEEWGETAEFIRNNELAEGATVHRSGLKNRVVFAGYRNPQLTLKGKEFLEQQKSDL